MNDELVEITLHGELGETIGEKWEICVSSVSEAMRAIQTNSGGKLFPYLFESWKREEKYQVIVDGKTLDTSDIDPSDPETVYNSELMINRKFKKLDIVPVIEGGLFVPILIGAGLLAAGMIFSMPLLIMIGLGLIISGLANLLAKPPDFEEFQQFTDVRAKGSYLFNGPTNALREGGPVPLGYGRLLLGSQVIGSSYVISYQENTDSTTSTSS
jgi:predicted phage tail protein